jgi:hypothetical protein
MTTAVALGLAAVTVNEGVGAWRGEGCRVNPFADGDAASARAHDQAHQQGLRRLAFGRE